MLFSYSLSDECLGTKLRVTENWSFPFLYFCYIYIYIYIHAFLHMYLFLYVYVANDENIISKRLL